MEVSPYTDNHNSHQDNTDHDKHRHSLPNTLNRGHPTTKSRNLSAHKGKCHKGNACEINGIVQEITPKTGMELVVPEECKHKAN